MEEFLKRKTVNLFEKDQDALDDAFKKQSPDIAAPEKLEKVEVIENDDGTFSKKTEEIDSKLYDDNVVGSVEGEIKQDSETLQEFCRDVDKKIISFNEKINAKKQEIVALTAEATERNCWPGIAYTSIGGERGGFSTPFGFSTSFSVIEDREAVEIYSKMAGPGLDYGADNPFDPTKIITLNSSNAGFGHENNRDNGRTLSSDSVTEISADDYNVGGSGDPEDDYLTSFESSANLGAGRDDISTDSADHLGPRFVGSAGTIYDYYYAGVGESPDASNTSLTGSAGASRCVEIINQINTLASEINTLRSERDAAVGGGDRADLNVVKEKKMEKELQNWGANNVRAKQTQRKTSNNSVITAVNNLSSL
jgi:hypothetical protein|tara:strand:+ start:2149 stop:3246 length:1098 start_codon:yes stop_codon:yes gene_type:complete